MLLKFLISFLAGSLGGALSGFLGIGGGLAYIIAIQPLLFYFNVPEEIQAQCTIANSLFAVMFASISVNISELKNKKGYPKEVLLTAFLAIISSNILLQTFIKSVWYTNEVYTYVILGILPLLLIQSIYNKKEDKKNSSQPTETIETSYYWLKTGLSGAFSGIISILTGFGGGVVLVPFLQRFTKVNIHKAKSISIGMIFIMSFFISISNLLAIPSEEIPVAHQGFIIFPIIIPIIIGASLGAPIGVKLSKIVKTQVIHLTFIIFVSVLIIKYFFKLFTV